MIKTSDDQIVVKARVLQRSPKGSIYSRGLYLKLGDEICPFVTDTCSKNDSSLVVVVKHSN